MPRHAPQATQRSPSSALALLRAHPARRRARRWYGLSPAVRNAQVSTRFLQTVCAAPRLQRLLHVRARLRKARNQLVVLAAKLQQLKLLRTRARIDSQGQHAVRATCAVLANARHARTFSLHSARKRSMASPLSALGGMRPAPFQSEAPERQLTLRAARAAQRRTWSGGIHLGRLLLVRKRKRCRTRRGGLAHARIPEPGLARHGVAVAQRGGPTWRA